MVDRLSWAEVRRLALHHRKALIVANLVALLTTLCTVPIPLLLPLLVDEVLLGKGDAALQVMNRFLPASAQQAIGYIGLMLLLTLLLLLQLLLLLLQLMFLLLLLPQLLLLLLLLLQLLVQLLVEPRSLMVIL